MSHGRAGFFVARKGMQLFLLTALTMVAFAANSILNKIGVAHGEMAPFGFALLRVVSGAAMLAVLLGLRREIAEARASLSFVGPLALIVYLVGFSLAYLTLDAGVGALILFGMVQLTMFAVSVLRRDAIPLGRWFGCSIAFGGLAYLLWPSGGDAPDLLGALLMSAAGIGWGVYTLSGQGARAPLAVTGANFAAASALMLLALPVTGLPLGNALGMTAALISGALTSALGYALWYRVLPRLETTVAATAQLTVPIIAMIGGMVLLSEALTLSFVIASTLVLGGVALSLRAK